MVDDLYDVLERLVNRNGLIISVTANDALYKKFRPHLHELLKNLRHDEFKREHYVFPRKKKNEGIYSQSRVQFVGKGANFIELGYQYNGALNILETILRYEYLWTKIRVQGGAYGAFASFGSPTATPILKRRLRLSTAPPISLKISTSATAKWTSTLSAR